MSVQELQAAVATLSPQEFTTFDAWLEEFKADAWDRQIEEDAHTGKLDELYVRLRKENESGESIPLDEVVHHTQLS